MIKLNKMILMTLLLISQAVIARTDNTHAFMTKQISDRYVVTDSISGKDDVRKLVDERLSTDSTLCDGIADAHLVDLIFTSSVYGPRYGERTFYVDIYYDCPKIK